MSGDDHGGMSTGNDVSGSVEGTVVQARRIDVLTVHHAAPASAWAVPRQLPLPRALVDRVRDRAELDRALPGGTERPGARWPVVLVLHGRAGVGTSALAVAWLHEHADRYPDGVLYADLRDGVDGGDPTATVTGFLLDLGVRAEDLPPAPAQRLARWRSIGHGRRLAVLLDGAGDVGQVVSVLPTGPGCLVVVTSRTPLTGLTPYGARLHEVGVLAPEHALDVLRGITAADRIGSDPDAAARLVEACAGTVRALTALGYIAARYPEVALDDLVAQFTCRPLDTLALSGDSAVVHALRQSYLRLQPQEQLLFRLLAAQPHAEFGVAFVEAVFPVDEDPLAHAPQALPPGSAPRSLRQQRLRLLLDGLCRAGLLVHHPICDTVRLDGIVPGPRWVMDPPARDLARGLSTPDHDGERDAAVVRAADLVWRVLHDADRVVTGYRRYRPHPAGGPGPHLFTDRGQALTWLEIHGRAVAAYAGALHGMGQHARAWHLVDGLWPLVLHRKHYGWRREIHALGLAAAQAWGDAQARAEMHKRRGMDALSTGEHAEAEGEFTAALTLRLRSGDERGAADVRMVLGRLHLDSAADLAGGPPRGAFAEGGVTPDARCAALDRAEAQLHRALAVYRDGDARRETALTLHLLAETACERGRGEEALGLLERAEALHAAVDPPDPYNAARTRAAIGRVLTRLGRHRLARPRLDDALRRLRVLGNTAEQARVLESLADLALATGDPAYRSLLVEALRLLQELDSPQTDRLAVRVEQAEAR